MTNCLPYMLIFLIGKFMSQGLNVTPPFSELAGPVSSGEEASVVTPGVIEAVVALTSEIEKVVTALAPEMEEAIVTQTPEMEQVFVTLTLETTTTTTPLLTGIDTTAVSKDRGKEEFTGSTTTEIAKTDPYAIIHQGTVSKEQYERCNIILNLMVKPVVCIGGIVMNVIGVCVLLQKQFRRSTYTYLCFLALSDICLLSFSCIKIIPHYVSFFDDIFANDIDMHLYPYNTIFLGTSFTRITEFCICALAIERLFAVLYPLKVKELFLCRHAFAVCISIWVFCILAHFHFLFVYYPRPYFNPSRNTTMWTLGRNSWYFDSGIKPVYDMIFQIIFLYGPIVVLVTCNVAILIRVRQINKERRNIVANDTKSKKMSNDEKRITITLLIISLTFLSVFVPVVMMTLISKFDNEFKLYGREHYLLSMMRDLVGFGSNVSSANDFIVYIFTSKQFKQALIDMVCRSKAKFKSPHTADSQIITAVTDTGSDGTSFQT